MKEVQAEDKRVCTNLNQEQLQQKMGELPGYLKNVRDVCMYVCMIVGGGAVHRVVLSGQGLPVRGDSRGARARDRADRDLQGAEEGQEREGGVQAGMKIK